MSSRGEQLIQVAQDKVDALRSRYDFVLYAHFTQVNAHKHTACIYAYPPREHHYKSFGCINGGVTLFRSFGVDGYYLDDPHIRSLVNDIF